MINIFVGNTGQGKTYMSALTALELLNRNWHWYKKGKTKVMRKLATNMALNPQLKKKFPEMIVDWNDMEQLINLRECDVIFDDMSAYLDSQRWQDTPMSVKRWLRLHEHYGCDIYGNAQDFLTIDPSVRRLTYSVKHVSKLMGSRRPSATKPEVKHIWGVLITREVAEEVMDQEKLKYKYVSWFPQLEFIKKEICNVFDTTQDLQVGEYPALHHIERKCLTCSEVKLRHI